MDTETLDAQVKTRVPVAVKEAFEAIAKERHLRPADIHREALREYLEKHKPADGQLGLPLVVNGNGADHL